MTCLSENRGAFAHLPALGGCCALLARAQGFSPNRPPAVCWMPSPSTQKTLFSIAPLSPQDEFCLKWIFSTSLHVSPISLVSEAEFLTRVVDSHCLQFLSSCCCLTHSETTSITDSMP